jgi:hypothetical protein
MFLAWSVAGACLALIVSQVGALTLAIGLLLVALLLWRARGREAIGLLAGAGAVAVLVGVINLGYNPCPSGPVVLKPGQTDFECGGFDGAPWLAVGLALMVVAAIAFRLMRRSAP